MATKNTEEAVQQQIDAMPAEVFEIGLFDPNSSRQMLPRVWDRNTSSINFLASPQEWPREKHLHTPEWRTPIVTN